MLKMTKKQAADRLGVGSETVRHWEAGQTQPPIERIPAILRFLGYDPFPEPKSIPDQLLAKRRTMGWSIRQAAAKLRVDSGTWSDWEQGGAILYRSHRVLVAQLLGLSDGDVEARPHAKFPKKASQRQRLRRRLCLRGV
jgi:transcriptional regulator with XRE-family HTH domain